MVISLKIEDISKQTKIFLLLSFLEGGSVMAAELLGAKMLAPFFGSSLYVWSSVMAVTLGGLASGYFIGGIYSSRENVERNLYRVLVLAACFTLLMPFTSQFALAAFGYLSLMPAVILSSSIILFPPVFLMGMVSPLIIRVIATNAEQAGKAAGTVYAISTVGGILATFGFGFYIIPNFGLSLPAIITGGILGILPAGFLLKRKDYRIAGFFLLFFLMLFRSGKHDLVNSKIEVIYSSEGLLGQILVLDLPNEIYYADSTRKGEKSRWLYVNRISQTMDDPHARVENGEERYFTYVYRIAEVVDTFSSYRKNALLLGLGGGSVAKMLNEKGFNVDACELDPRIFFVAKNYFNLPEAVSVYIDDARHYIRSTVKKYDVIIFDTFKGEETPSHILTKESLVEVKDHLNADGMIFINSFGYINGKRGLGARSIYKTMTESGLKTQIWPTGNNPDLRNLLFVASSKEFPVHRDFLKMEKVNLDDAFILSDEYPKFEIINASAGLSWRRAAIEQYKLDPLQREIPVFE